MSNHIYAIVEAILVCVAIFGLATWQLVAVRRNIRRDRQAADAEKAPEP